MPSIRKSYIIRYFTQWKWSLWFQWVLINTLAWMSAFWAFTKTRDLLENWLSQFTVALSPALLIIPGTLIFGMVLGFSQSLWLRKKLDVSRGWTRATVIAYAFLLILPASLNPAIHTILSGALIGLAQWLILRKTFRAHFWWLLLSGGSWITGEIAVQWVSRQSVLNFYPILHAGIHGIVYGTFTGFGIIALFQYANSPRGILQLRDTAPPRKAVFIASWIMMNAIGWGIGFGSIGQTLRDAILATTGLPFRLLFEKASLEGIVALFIWGVLWRQWFRGSFWWVIWSSIGSAAGIFLWTFSGFENATGIIVYGAVVGFFQWFILSQQVRGFFLWMGIRTIAWAGSLGAVSKIGQRFTIDTGWVAGGLIYGILTGALLFWRFRQGTESALGRKR